MIYCVFLENLMILDIISKKIQKTIDIFKLIYYIIINTIITITKLL